MSILPNSEDPDEMSHDGVVHQGLHCILRQKRLSEKYTVFSLILKIIFCYFMCEQQSLLQDYTFV